MFSDFCLAEPLVLHHQAQLDVIILHITTVSQQDIMLYVKYMNSALSCTDLIQCVTK